MSLITNNHYACDTQSILGRGSFGNVYMGYKLCNGEPVAMKVFRRNVPQHNLKQEFEILKIVDHVNIVRLISIEHHPQLGNFLVMELCTDGSLLTVLEHPKNFYGLDEDEFLQLLRDVTGGMKYLRSKNFIHRDIKPGNILRSRRDDGQFIYKLTDFGAARILEDGESFTSIYGTEEYLHPDIYGFALCNAPKGKNFKATVDLWSIGVTLYQAATGKIPFKAFDGRRDRKTMFKITSTKPSGAISGTQSEFKGEILWETGLPDTCRLNSEFKSTVTRLLIGLLEPNPASAWSFDVFFNEVDEILSMKKCVIFYVNHFKFLETYLKPDDRYASLQAAIVKGTGIAPDDQMIFSKYNLVSEKGQSISANTKQDPLILFDKNNADKCEIELSFLNIAQSSEDNVARQLEANEYVNENQIDEIFLINGLFKHAAKLICNVVSQQQAKPMVNSSVTSACSLTKNTSDIRDEFVLELSRIKELELEAAGLSTDNSDATVDDCVRSTKMLNSKIRAHRDAVRRGNDSERRGIHKCYVVHLSRELVHSYSVCQANFSKLAGAMRTWCDGVKLILAKMAASNERWARGQEKLANAIDEIVAAKRTNRANLRKSIRELEAVTGGALGAVTNQRSAIQEIDQLIGNVVKIQNTTEELQ